MKINIFTACFVGIASLSLSLNAMEADTHSSSTNDATLHILQELIFWNIGSDSHGEKFGESTYATKTSADSIWFNRAFAYPSTTQADVTSVITYFDGHGFSWWVAEDDDDTKKLLVANGFVFNQKEYLMKMDLQQSAESEKKEISQLEEETSNITIQAVKNNDDLNVWIKTSAKGFGLPVETMSAFINKYICATGDWDRTTFLIAYINSTPASTGMCINHQNSVPFAGTIHLVSTIEEYRKQALATNIIEALLPYIYLVPCNSAQLFSSEMAHKWLQTTNFLGESGRSFKDIKTYEVYTKNGAAYSAASQRKGCLLF